jgi:alpha-1,6-mannosyltransferase
MGIEAFLLALYVVAPVGGVTQTISPLARAWPWLLWPARAVFGPTMVNASLTPSRGWPALALFATLLVGASCAWSLAVWQARDLTPQPPLLRGEREAKWGLWVALGGAAVMGLTLALLPSLPSDDVFSYILYGRISAVHNANPLIATPADFPNDPFLSLVYWQTTRSVYGPVWLGLSDVVTRLAQALGGSLAVYVALFKLVGLLAHLANVALVWAILGRIGQLTPGRRLAGTLFYAWSPLCLLEFSASAHNDAVMLTFLLLGIYALTRGWEVAGLALIGLAIATKLTPVALLPLFGSYVAWRERAAGATWARVARELAWRAGVVALTLIVTVAPLWAGPKTLGALLFSPPAQQLDNSLIEAVSWPLRWLAQGALGLSVDQARAVVETGLKALALVVFAALWLWEFRRTRTLGGTLTAWGWALLWYALVASGWFWPWYVTWVVALAAVAPWGRLQVATALLAGGALTLYGFIPLQASLVYGYRSFVAFGPVVAYLAWRGWQRWLAWRERGGEFAR